MSGTGTYRLSSSGPDPDPDPDSKELLLWGFCMKLLFDPARDDLCRIWSQEVHQAEG